MEALKLSYWLHVYIQGDRYLYAGSGDSPFIGLRKKCCSSYAMGDIFGLRSLPFCSIQTASSCHFACKFVCKMAASVTRKCLPLQPKANSVAFSKSQTTQIQQRSPTIRKLLPMASLSTRATTAVQRACCAAPRRQNKPRPEPLARFRVCTPHPRNNRHVTDPNLGSRLVRCASPLLP